MSKVIKFIKVDNKKITKKQLEKDLEQELGKDVTIIGKSKLTGVWKIEVNENVTLFRLAKISDTMSHGNIEDVYEDFEVNICLDNAVKGPTKIIQVWDDLGLTGKGVTIGIADTGVDINHPDIKDRILDTEDFVNESGGDKHGHGTHCATIAIGDGAGSNGKYKGVACEAKSYIAKVLNKNGSGTASQVVDGIEWLAEKGVDIISLSLGGPMNPFKKDIIELTCEAAWQAGIVVVAANGNSGPGSGTVGTPGGNKVIIGVGATDDKGVVTNFSSRGPARDAEIKPDVSAPGLDIIAGRATGTSMGSPVNALYTSASGTSMATPIVAGLVALLIQNKSSTPNAIKQQLKDQADFLFGLTQWYNDQGWGIVNAYDSVIGTKPKEKPDPKDKPPPPKDGKCFLTRVFGSSSFILPVARIVRDECLDRSVFGRRLIKWYYML